MAVHRVDWGAVSHASWIGFPKTIVSPTFGPLTGPPLPAFKLTFILLVIPSVIALLAENSGHVKAVSEILFGFCPKFGAVVAATPGGVLGGITLVLYGMIGLLGAKIWIENRVDFANPANLVPLAGGIIAGIGNLAIKFTSTFSITGIAAGTLIVLTGYHAVRPFAHHLRDEPQAGGRAYEGGAAILTGNIDTPEGEILTQRDGEDPAPPGPRDPGT